jgi:hypothetical protein
MNQLILMAIGSTGTHVRISGADEIEELEDLRIASITSGCVDCC